MSVIISTESRAVQGYDLIVPEVLPAEIGGLSSSAQQVATSVKNIAFILLRTVGGRQPIGGIAGVAFSEITRSVFKSLTSRVMGCLTENQYVKSVLSAMVGVAVVYLTADILLAVEVAVVVGLVPAIIRESVFRSAKAAVLQVTGPTEKSIQEGVPKPRQILTSAASFVCNHTPQMITNGMIYSLDRAVRPGFASNLFTDISSSDVLAEFSNKFEDMVYLDALQALVSRVAVVGCLYILV